MVSKLSPGSTREPILKEGDTCWRKVRAERVAFIVDAADYFEAAKDAILKAERCVYLIGWEFDLEVRLCPEADDPDIPDQLRLFLQYVAEERPDLEIFVLQWRGAMMFNVARQLGSFLLLKASAKPQIHFRLDGEHPPGGCHHQKIVVIDDVLAFCGGIDMTSGRWDNSRHRSGNPSRGEEGDRPMPWHDMTLALEGDAAKALGELARQRWKNATGNDLPVPSRKDSIWPETIDPDLRDAVVGIARNSPKYKDNPQISEIENLWCDAIASARRTIYIENQFLSSGKIADALKAKLQEEDGPDIAIVLPCSAESWLESEAMDTRRSLIVTDLREADRNGRLGVYHPVNEAGEPIYVHAKLLIVDDDFVRVGSSNMASRSLSSDTECDLAMETADQPELREVLIRLRTQMIAEHLGLSMDAVTAELEKSDGRIHSVIERLRYKNGRTLEVLKPRELNDTEMAMAQSRLLDPEEPIALSRRVADFAHKAFQQNRGVIAIAGMTAAGWAARQFVRRR